MANPLAHKAQKTFQQRNDQFRQFINDMIKAPTIVIIDNDGNNLGTFRRDEALRVAEEQSLDLIQMRYDPTTMTSTCKMMDYGKYQYLKKKGEGEKRQTANKGMKELEISYNIWDNDLDLKVKKGIEILQDGYQLRFAIKLRGRENMFRDKGLAKLQKAVEWIGEAGRSQGIKTEPKGYSAIFAPKGNKK
jgi:translation initiation factor IF-3